MILIGSQAAVMHGIDLGRPSPDVDMIVPGARMPALMGLYNSKSSWIPVDESHVGIRLINEPGVLDIEIAWHGSSADRLLNMAEKQKWPIVWIQFGNTRLEAYLPPLHILLLLKLSHRYKKDSPHFLKTMRDIQLLRTYAPHDQVFNNPNWHEDNAWFVEREAETYSYQHPNLKRTKAQFFSNDSVQYKYDHDTLHLAVKVLDVPTYHLFSTPGQEVLSSRARFNALPEQSRRLAVLEESYVLALERSQIPFNFTLPRKLSFDIALEKVCTSITSGWFREFAWENYDIVQSMYDLHYVDHFHGALAEGIVKEFKP